MPRLMNDEISQKKKCHSSLNCRRKKVKVWSSTHVLPWLMNDEIPQNKKLFIPSHSSQIPELSQKKSKSLIQYLCFAMAHKWWNFTEKKNIKKSRLLTLYLCPAMMTEIYTYLAMTLSIGPLCLWTALFFFSFPLFWTCDLDFILISWLFLLVAIFSLHSCNPLDTCLDSYK